MAMAASSSALDFLDDEAADTEEEEDEYGGQASSSAGESLKRSSGTNGDDDLAAAPPDELLKKKPRVVAKPFSEEMLTSRDGLMRIYEEFPMHNAFRGRGFEAQDLRKVIKMYKEWAFQLYPGLAFPDMIDRCETLGAKGAVRGGMVSLRERERNRYTQDVLGVPLTQILRQRRDAATPATHHRDRDGDGDGDGTSPEDLTPEEARAEPTIPRAREHDVGDGSNSNSSSSSSSSSGGGGGAAAWGVTEIDDDALLRMMSDFEQTHPAATQPTQAYTQLVVAPATSPAQEVAGGVADDDGIDLDSSSDDDDVGAPADPFLSQDEVCDASHTQLDSV